MRVERPISPKIVSYLTILCTLCAMFDRILTQSVTNMLFFPYVEGPFETKIKRATCYMTYVLLVILRDPS